MKDTHDALLARSYRRSLYAAYTTQPRRNKALGFGEKPFTEEDDRKARAFEREVHKHLDRTGAPRGWYPYACFGWQHFDAPTWARTGLPSFTRWLQDGGGYYSSYRAFAMWRAGVPPQLASHPALNCTHTAQITRRNLPLILAGCSADAARGAYYLDGHSLRVKARIEMLPLVLRCVAATGPTDRLRNVDWGKIRKVRDQIAAKPGVAVAWLPRAEADALASSLTPVSLAEDAAYAPYYVYLRRQYPAYQDCGAATLKRLMRGESPVEILGGNLTSKEAHDCLKHHPGKYWDGYLMRDVPRGGWPETRAVEVLRFVGGIAAAGQWDKVTKRREGVDYAGKVRAYTYAEYIKRLMPEDLTRGERTPINTAFENCIRRVNAAERKMAATNAAPLRDLAAEMAGAIYPKCMRYLNSLGELMVEGSQMRHCVGSDSYAQGVRMGHYAIFSLNVNGQRSTLCIDANGHIREHYGANDSRPHEWCAQVAGRFAARLRAPYEARRKAEREAEAKRAAAEAAARGPIRTYEINCTLHTRQWDALQDLAVQMRQRLYAPRPPAEEHWYTFGADGRLRRALPPAEPVALAAPAARPQRPQPQRNAYAELDDQTDAVSYGVDGRAYTREATATDAARLEWRPALDARVRDTHRALAMQVAPMLV